ncbi:MAG: hypothetical protein PUF12_07055 [Thermoflexaceae bacterium]|nr:hypothetical protein [Thermoflexaceae bacterium]
MKKNTLNIIILTLVVINLVLNVLIIFSVIPTANRTNNLIMKISEIIDLELKPEYETDNALSIDQIDPRIITNADGKTSLTISVPSSDGKNHYAIVTVTVSLDKTNKDYEKLSESFDNAKSLIISKVDMVISSYTYETVQNSKAEIQEKLLEEIRSLFQSDMIYDVSTQILVQ